MFICLCSSQRFTTVMDVWQSSYRRHRLVVNGYRNLSVGCSFTGWSTVWAILPGQSTSATSTEKRNRCCRSLMALGFGYDCAACICLYLFLMNEHGAHLCASLTALARIQRRTKYSRSSRQSLQAAYILVLLLDICIVNEFTV